MLFAARAALRGTKIQQLHEPRSYAGVSTKFSSMYEDSLVLGSRVIMTRLVTYEQGLWLNGLFARISDFGCCRSSGSVNARLVSKQSWCRGYWSIEVFGDIVIWISSECEVSVCWIHLASNRSLVRGFKWVSVLFLPFNPLHDSIVDRVFLQVLSGKRYIFWSAPERCRVSKITWWCRVRPRWNPWVLDLIGPTLSGVLLAACVSCVSHCPTVLSEGSLRLRLYSYLANIFCPIRCISLKDLLRNFT